MRFTITKDDLMKLARDTFQFSLWDSKKSCSGRRAHIRVSFNSLYEIQFEGDRLRISVKPLSILFMRFLGDKTGLFRAWIVAFNSLYEIRSLLLYPLLHRRRQRLSILFMRFTGKVGYIYGFFISAFQFSLWDSRKSKGTSTKAVPQHFQFSLWDSEPVLADVDGQLGKLFQFSLWDSRWGLGRRAARRRPFQFSLWDSRWSNLYPSFFIWPYFQFSLWDSYELKDVEAKLTILLSILFMRFTVRR